MPLSIGASAVHDQSPLLTQTYNGPSIENARANAPEIFNAIHSSMRQWGSSLKHNGMSFFPARVPKGTLFYHGTHTAEPVEGMEWLAFEIEHAEIFAHPRRGHGPGGHGPGKGPGDHPPGGPGRGRPPNVSMDTHAKPEYDRKIHGASGGGDEDGHGYLHTYRTSKPLTKLLYIDGLSAGKTSMGTLDSTDYIVRNLSPASTEPNDDWIRAADLCKIGEQWGIEGFLRMEAGFEIILCSFKDGVEFLSASRRDEKSGFGKDDVGSFEYVRALGYRYQGIMGGRVDVDYSSMISAFFYPINLTNPDASRSELPRLTTASETDDLRRIRSDLLELFRGEEYAKRETINWQNVVDMIVTRYSDRLKFMIQDETSEATVLSEIKLLLDIHTDYTKINVHSSIEKCANHFLQPVVPQTEADHLLHAAIFEVSHNICSTLFQVRELLNNNEAQIGNKAEKGKKLIKGLINQLDWTTWLECGKCAYDERPISLKYLFRPDSPKVNKAAKTISSNNTPYCDRYKPSSGIYRTVPNLAFRVRLLGICGCSTIFSLWPLSTCVLWKNMPLTLSVCGHKPSSSADLFFEIWTCYIDYNPVLSASRLSMTGTFNPRIPIG
ncbi:hypothetical protein EYC80_010670 [Monilinia laxa]|uniref:Uncharacterized protein n=1 Tax=Monilinia laxa TaxID=61186 RepID=A0A5N6JMD3_MONLA|nr:hypothetical protein EYC80_010670 [Monilinia laxa]